MRSSLFSTAVLTALLAASSSQIALAQIVAPETGQQIAPGRDELQDRTRQQPPPASRLKIEGDIERAPCALDSPAYANLKVTINDVQFNNLQGVSPEELRQSYAALLGADRPVSTICAIRDAAATALRRKGYLAAVLVPVQKIEDGVVRFEVLFARIVQVRVRGEAGNAETVLASYLSHLTEEKVFNRYVAERYLLLARDMPGYEVRLVLKPAGTGPGELVGEVSVVHTPIEINASLQNFSARSSGRWTGAVQAQAYGLLGADRLTASVSSTADFKEQQVVQLGYETKLGGEGLTVGGNFTYAWSKPDVRIPGFPGLDLTARTLFATGELRYPLVRTQRFSLVGAAGMDFVNQTVRFAGQDLTRDRLRVGFLRLDMDMGDVPEGRAPTWRASGSLEFRQGLDLFDASPRPRFPLPLVRPARTDGDPTSSLIRGSAAIEYNLGKGFWFAALPRFQYAFDPLFSFEEFSAGNYSIGRGYDPGTIIGDSGLGSGFELRLPRFQPLEKTHLAVQPFVFTDLAWVWNRHNAFTFSLPRNPDFLASAGGGFRAVLDNRFRIEGTIAVPLKAAGLQTHNHDPRFLVSLVTKLWPWGN
ncbi:ShlB/FhaC/HecB family hemolysin secretion/activation protein [Rhizorhabdus histidinilytica]|uniref:ShlB/FhaC/HecB family hemolysin secretion/activation protein n=1 Tax=Rhizorhabdus histidinilytica TaxID=439228 RepID=UPI0009A650C8|nr:ShlB/FhaC/HecB family hemolysin secretion/activation protein [Rhizorhabdus histidinilytica]